MPVFDLNSKDSKNELTGESIRRNYNRYLYASLLAPSLLIVVCMILFPGPNSADELPPANIVVSDVIEHFWWLGLLPHIIVPFFLKHDWWKSVIASLALLPAYFLIIFVAVMSIRSDFI